MSPTGVQMYPQCNVLNTVRNECKVILALGAIAGRGSFLARNEDHLADP